MTTSSTQHTTHTHLERCPVSGSWCDCLTCALIVQAKGIPAYVPPPESCEASRLPVAGERAA